MDNVFIVFQRSDNDGCSICDQVCATIERARVEAQKTRDYLTNEVESEWVETNRDFWTDGENDIYIKKYEVYG